MIKRIELVLQSQNLTPSQFADRIGIQRSGLSHILSGRNNPSLDFVQKVLTAFPELNPAWFLQGKGRMYVNLTEAETVPLRHGSASDPAPDPLGFQPVFSGSRQGADELDSDSDSLEKDADTGVSPVSPEVEQCFSMMPEEPKRVIENLFSDDRGAKTSDEIQPEMDRQPERDAHPCRNEPKVRRILLFYEDGTFEEYAKR